MRIRIAPDLRLFVDIEGAGLVPDGPTMRAQPTLLLVHGGPGMDHTGFKPTFSPLAGIAQLVYVDLRGHGRSDRVPWDAMTLDAYADDLVRLCDALGIVKPVVLAQSFGGYVAQRYLARHPGHPAKVVLAAANHRWDLERIVANFERAGGPDAAAAGRALWGDPDAERYARFREVCVPLYGATALADCDAATRGALDLDVLFHWLRGELRTLDTLPGLSAVRCPVLVMVGDRDPVCPADAAREIAAAIPAPWARLEVFDNTGHSVWRERPAEAFALLREFILS